MTKNLIKATHGSSKTPLAIGAIKIPCYVLEDGTRVLSGRGIQKALGSPSSSGQWLQSFINSKAISPYFTAGILEQLNNPIKFIRPDAGGSQSETYGYEATLLIDIIDAIIDAERAGANINEIVVLSAHTLSKALKRISIIALVDEATGYQYDRERDALQVILKAYVADGLLPWQKRFPDVFYREIFRLRGWDFTTKGINDRPGVIGTWTNKLIYEQLPNGVLEELKRKTPKSKAGNYTARFTQSLSLDIGHPHLQAQLNRIIALMQASDTWEQFIKNFNKVIKREAGQTELQLEYPEEKQNPLKSDTHNMDKMLKGILSVPKPPKE